ncbi:hypothetical protein ABZU86_28890 [Streptomyces sp. NPDC005271]|uniref:hypothetical protein n=1 Tax=unclassified Streptomyces TaxID=2593676 RepID=UPI0033A95FB2
MHCRWPIRLEPRIRSATEIVAWCSDGGKWPGAIGNNYVRNRSNASISINYDFNGDGQIQWWNEQVARLNEGQAATLNPNSRYFYCQGDHPNP